MSGKMLPGGNKFSMVTVETGPSFKVVRPAAESVGDGVFRFVWKNS